MTLFLKIHVAGPDVAPPCYFSENRAKQGDSGRQGAAGSSSLLDGETVREVAASGRLDTDDGDILAQWALAGEGVVLKPAFEAAEYLRAGTLRLVLAEHPPDSRRPSVLHAYQRMTPPKVQAFGDALQAFGDALIEQARAHFIEALDGIDLPVRAKQRPKALAVGRKLR